MGLDDPLWFAVLEGREDEASALVASVDWDLFDYDGPGLACVAGHRSRRDRKAYGGNAR
ncbi:hypothetical protein Lesp02_05750 [Lentzea sp. NBRC 105346]|nr:hypothetical protein Lesp02_05750 [Lentzea sp. NBRC 105346]